MAAQEPDFDPVFYRLKAILEPYAGELYVSADDEKNYGVDMAPASERNPTTWFGAVRRGKRYVSIYLMPVYVDPGLLDDASPELRKRMQGKSCFNFKVRRAADRGARGARPNRLRTHRWRSVVGRPGAWSAGWPTARQAPGSKPPAADPLDGRRR